MSSSKRSPTLLTVLLHFGDLSVEVVRTLTALLTFPKMASLLSITKEMRENKNILFQPPPEWINDDEVRMMFCAMLGTTESQWKRRIDTSLVETLVLGPVDDTWMTEVFNVVVTNEKFPNLTSLDLSCCNITDVGMVEVGKCTNLQSLDLS